MKPVSLGETAGSTGIRAVDRVCTVLSAFSATHPELTLRELVTQTRLPKATAYRLANSLVATGFLRHFDDGHYALGLKLAELGDVARRQVDVAEACTPVLDALADHTGESVLLAAADWDALELVVIVARVSQQTLAVHPLVGRRFEITAGALGKALLMSLNDAELERVLSRAKLPALTEHTCVDRTDFLHELEEARPVGYVIAKDEFVDGVGGVAVPVLFDGGRPRAAISVAGPSIRIEGQLEHFGQLMLRLTAALQPGMADLGSPTGGH